MDGPKDKTIINYNMPYNMENDKGNDSVLIVIYDRGSFHTTQQGAFHKQLLLRGRKGVASGRG